MSSFAFMSDSRFLGCGPLAAGARFGVAGIAWDGSTTNRPGARFGPQAIRRASRMLCDGTHPLFGVSPTAVLGDAGDLMLPNTSLERMREALVPAADALIARHHMVWLGGDHSVTLPLLRAYRARLGRPLAVVHFDAHCDTWADHFGEPSGHGTWVREAVEQGLVEPRCVVQFGIRSAAEAEPREYLVRRGGTVHDARALRGVDRPSELQALVDDFRARWQAHGSPPPYLTFDIDCLDPAFAPGTGTPEPGGLGSHQALSLLEAMAGLPFVGMDCVEVAPPYDHAELTALAAANVVWTYLCGRMAGAAATNA